MKTRTTKTVKRDRGIGRTEEQTTPVFYVVASAMNEEMGDDEKIEPEEDREPGYPDFYEDTDNMNRYLW